MKTVLITGACVNTGVAIVNKFASEGWNIVFTGRNKEKVREAETSYHKAFPDVQILGYSLTPLIDDRTVDEKAAEDMFEFLDSKGIFIEL